ncbi:MAG: glycosyltransferase [Spirochaetaceae bacterium]|jgi:UDP:flavonoid glycosyltransferase YjiC (YdhE family)|nr:glycosyltransferase [Spirochaetaceae bacterium]
MKIFLVTRGSQGDIYPYLEVARALKLRGHDVFFSLPREFEALAKNFNIPYQTQAFDDITGMLDTAPGTRELLAWMRRVIVAQFDEYIPIVKEHDLFIAANTEFAAPSIAECCGKPLIRTAFAPLLPSLTIPPPVIPFPRRSPLMPPRLLWAGLNIGVNLLTKKIINGKRQECGLAPIADQGQHAPAYADNFLLYSPTLGCVDQAWPYRWHIGGYMFGDDIPYDMFEHKRFMEFVYKDQKPLVFFTMGSCKSTRRDFLCDTLFAICERRGWKLAVGADWWKGNEAAKNSGDVFMLNSFVPHARVFPHCTAIIHHGGSGTTHSAARSGRPQLAMPLLLDQHYWGERVRSLGLGPAPVRVKTVSAAALERTIRALMENKTYETNARALAEKVRRETGLKTFIDYIEKEYGAPR